MNTKDIVEECCDSVQQENASVWLKRKARALREQAARMEKLADEIDHLSRDAQTALFELAK